MKNVEYCSVCQGSANKKGLGWVKRIGVFGLSMACLLSPIGLGSSKASDAIITQLAYLQWLAQVVGDTAQLPANASAADYVAWARSLNVEPAGGWHPAALMTSDSYAQTMAQLLGIAVANPDGRNLKRELEKEDIKVPDKITTHNLTLMEAALVGFVTREDEAAYFSPGGEEPRQQPLAQVTGGTGKEDDASGARIGHPGRVDDFRGLRLRAGLPEESAQGHRFSS